MKTKLELLNHLDSEIERRKAIHDWVCQNGRSDLASYHLGYLDALREARQALAERVAS